MVMITSRDVMGQVDDRSDGDQGNRMGNRARQAHDEWMQKAFAFASQIDEHRRLTVTGLQRMERAQAESQSQSELVGMH